NLVSGLSNIRDWSLRTPRITSRRSRNGDGGIAGNGVSRVSDGDSLVAGSDEGHPAKEIVHTVVRSAACRKRVIGRQHYSRVGIAAREADRALIVALAAMIVACGGLRPGGAMRRR